MSKNPVLTQLFDTVVSEFTSLLLYATEVLYRLLLSGLGLGIYIDPLLGCL